MSAEKPAITFTGAQLKEMMEFLIPDANDPDQLESELTVQWVEKHTEDGVVWPAGLYCWLTQYPDEGAILLS